MKLVLKIVLIFLGFCPEITVGQNLLPNPNFEDTVDVKVTPLYSPKAWYAATSEGFNYMTPFNNTPTQHLLFSSPSNFPGYQVARSGQAYVGMLIYHVLYPNPPQRNGRREYMQARITKPLIADSTYCFQIYLSLADSVHFASRNQLGVYFSNNTVSAPIFNNLPYTPQIIVSPNNYVTDKVNWVQYNSSYKALGGEEYITIGNFNDTTGLDTLFVGGGDQNNVDYLNTYYYIDDVYLGHCDSVPGLATTIEEQDQKANFKIYPNPSRGVFQIELENQAQAVFQFQLYDIKGRLLFEEELLQSKSLDLGHLPSGLYHYRLMSNGVSQKIGKVIIQK